MASGAAGRFDRILDPIDRLSEVLFGLIMVLTSTGTLSVLSAGKPEVRTMILGALGCNLAWGIIDAGLYLMGCIDDRARNLKALRAIRAPGDPDKSRAALAGALPERLASVLSREELDSIRERLVRLPEPPPGVRVTKDDVLGALAVCLLVFLSTLPVVIPFMVIENVQPALRVSNAVAITMLFFCGYFYARHAGLHPWWTGLALIATGIVLVGVAIALGG